MWLDFALIFPQHWIPFTIIFGSNESVEGCARKAEKSSSWRIFLKLFYCIPEDYETLQLVCWNLGLPLKRNCAAASMHPITSSARGFNSGWQHSLKNKATKAGRLVPLRLTSPSALNVQFRLSVTANRNVLKTPLSSDIRQSLTRKLETLINTI